jgi:hypothetical protein
MKPETFYGPRCANVTARSIKDAAPVRRWHHEGSKCFTRIRRRCSQNTQIAACRWQRRRQRAVKLSLGADAPKEPRRHLRALRISTSIREKFLAPPRQRSSQRDRACVGRTPGPPPFYEQMWRPQSCRKTSRRSCEYCWIDHFPISSPCSRISPSGTCSKPVMFFFIPTTFLVVHRYTSGRSSRSRAQTLA